MKTCVLFPNAFSQTYLDGSAARKACMSGPYEVHLDPHELSQSSGFKSRNKNLSLLSNHSRSENKQLPSLLHVEDSPQLRLLMSVFLKNHFRVVSVPSGSDALREAEKGQYDIVCVDINLGEGIDGFETSRRLRELEQYQHTLIIALTTLDYQNVREECFKSRINAYIQKPFDKMCLLGTMEELDKKVLKNIQTGSHA